MQEFNSKLQYCTKMVSMVKIIRCLRPEALTCPGYYQSQQNKLLHDIMIIGVEMKFSFVNLFITNLNITISTNKHSYICF